MNDLARMTSHERRVTLALASILSIRMIGLFIILPIFALHAQTLPHATPTLIGLAIGIYGFTQALFQVPMGMLSDRFGRKPIIISGLLLFALGSILAAVSTSIIGIILGRALQGCGAIAATVLALTADLTREEQRTKTMAFLGISIGLSFILALSIGPLLSEWVSISGLFWLTAFSAMIAIAILYLFVPDPVNSHFHHETELTTTQLKTILTNTQLLRLDIGILLLHALLTSLFVVIPIALDMHLTISAHWKIYLPVLVGSMLMIVPLIIIAEKRRHLKGVFVAAITLLGISQIGFSYWHHSLFGAVVMLLCFFVAFNLLEASLPSLLSKIAPADSKGTAMGVYSSAQFLGAFLGGIGSGWLYHHYGIEAVFVGGFILTIVWLLLAMTMQTPPYLSSQLLNVGCLDKHRAKQLTQCLAKIPGVAEVVVIIEDRVAYLKVDRRILDMTALYKCPCVNALLKAL